MANSEDYITIKYNSVGEKQWIARYDGSDNDLDWASNIEIDNAGDVIVTGKSDAYYYSGYRFNYILTTIKYDNSGMQKWIANYYGFRELYGYYESILLAIDKYDNVFVSGSVKIEIYYMTVLKSQR
ncbi:MAG: hypothetical protein MUC94_08675 [bacterium]|nr:hypothetical protein [bacterium]